MLGMGNKENEEVLTEKEIVHNAMLVMVSRHDTTSILHTFILRFLANEPAIYAAVPQGIHNDIICNNTINLLKARSVTFHV